MSATSFTLGAFILSARIGQGAMGEVWRGVHATTDLAVAVKILKPRGARPESHRESLRNEVRAIAQLHHPGIIAVLEQGDVDAQAAEGSGGALTEGSPYHVMEYASCGALSDLRKPLRWSDLRAILLCLLDALAHAHARGLIHRDIKPANVLMAGPDDARPGLKLTDFGIAHALEPARWDQAEEVSIGTPRYMAPEQFDGLWRDHGPWTDLYALGGVAYELATGEFPYKGNNFITLALQHRTLPLPRLSDEVAVPPGFGAWIARMMAKKPAERFQRAADAAWALLELEASADWVDTSAAMPARVGRAVNLALGPVQEAASMIGQRWSLPLATLMSASQIRRIGGDVGPTVAPLPQSWRPTVPMEPSLALVGAGIELFGLRSVPVVGRLGERDALWAALGQVHGRWRPRLLVLRGASGVGKSRLAEWLCERADELGAASAMSARHAPTLGPSDGLPAMLARHTRCVGLSHEDAAARLCRTLAEQGVEDERLLRGLLAIMEPALGQGQAAEPAQSPSQWYEHLARYLEIVARERPLILWLDDVQWGRDALAFATALLERGVHRPVRVLIVATADEEPLVEREVERDLLAEALDFEAAESMAVPPLPEEDCTRLFEALLGLEGALAAALARRCAGLPVFALTLVEDWVQRGLLETGRHGFVLRAGVEGAMPEDLQVLWAGRVDGLLADQPPSSALALELAATLGQDVEDAEWELACRCAGVPAPTGLSEVLAQARFAEPTEGGWRFVHGGLRESLERRAVEAGRWQRHNLACALMITRRAGGEGASAAERLGRHFLAAREHEVALRYLNQGAAERQQSGDHRAVLALAALIGAALLAQAVPERDQRWGRVWLLQSSALAGLGKLSEAQTLASKVEGMAIACGWRAMAADTARAQGEIAAACGDLNEAAACFKRALGVHQRAGDLQGVAMETLRLGEVSLWAGELARASELLLAARAMLDGLGQAAMTPRTIRGLGHVELRRGALTRARELMESSLRLAEALGDSDALVRARRGLGDVARFEGALDEAEALYKRVEGQGDEGARARMGLAMLALQGRRVSEALGLLKAAQATFERPSRPGLLAIVCAMMAPCAALTGDWAGLDRHLERIEALASRSGVVDLDLATPLGMAAQVATLGGRRPEARRAAAASLAQWERLGRPDRARVMEALLGELGP